MTSIQPDPTSGVSRPADQSTVRLDTYRRVREAEIARLSGLLAPVPSARLTLVSDGGAASSAPATSGIAVHWSRLRRAAFTKCNPASLDRDERIIVMALAVARASEHRLIFSQGTAAALWGLPRIGDRTELVEFATAPGTCGRSPQVRRRRMTTLPRAVDLGGQSVTDLDQTLIDHARYADLESAIAMCDTALHLELLTRESLQTLVRGLPRRSRGCRMADLAVHLADARSESPLESLSRTRMFQLGLPVPELQVDFCDAQGFIGRVDFYWPELGIVGEADGMLKYHVPQGLSGESVGEVLRAEKSREDRLRRHQDVQSLVRWGWDDALPLHTFHALMHAAGIRPNRNARWPTPDGPLPRKSRHASVIERTRK